VGYLFKNRLFRFRLAKYHESKNKRHRPNILCGSQKRAKAKKAGAGVRWTRISKTTIETKKALEESHHSENGSCGLQHTPYCI